MAKRRIRLFRYRVPHHAARTLRALRAAHPQTSFALVAESMGFGFNIMATRHDGARGLVEKTPLSSFGNGG
jgi:hypothetical protein